MVAVILAAVPVGPGGAGTIHAADGLQVTSTYTYTIDLSASVVRVVAEMEFTNQVPDRVDGNYREQTYFHGFEVGLPAEATNAVATQDGAPVELTMELVAGTPAVFRASIEFESNLFYRDTARVVLTYDIVSHAPRSQEVTRINNAYASFVAFGIADPGRLTVRVVAPTGYEVETFGSDVTRTEDGGNSIFTATGIEQPEEFSILISARNDAALVATEHQVGDGTFLVRSWPGDTEWSDFVAGQLSAGVPALEEMVGQSWPQESTVEVVEAVTPYLYGYAGWFDTTSGIIEVGEELDARVMLHELAHAWFNEEWFEDRWITEGLASAYADHAAEQAGGVAEAPQPISTTAAGARPLNEWSEGVVVAADEESAAVEDFGYNASWYVVDALVAEIGLDGMRDVLAATDGDLIVYGGDGPPEVHRAAGDWRRFLDRLEEVGGASEASTLFEQYVVADAERDELEARAEARGAYDQLDAAGGDWATPRVVRQAMASWSFDRAGTLMAEATDVLQQRDDVLVLLDDLGVDIDPAIEETYETQPHLDDTAELLTDAAEGASGALSVRSQLVAAMAAIEVAPTTAFHEVYAPDGATIEMASTTLAELAAATDAVTAALELRDERSGLLDRIGLLGSDTDERLDEARAALAAGDADAAVAQAREASDTVEGARRAGTVRASMTLGAIALVAAAAIVLVILRRRRVGTADGDGDAPPEASARADDVRTSQDA